MRRLALRLVLLLAVAACGGGGSARERSSATESPAERRPERRDPDSIGGEIVGERPASSLELVEVDDGSQLMQRLFARVGRAYNGSATDPAAKALDVRVEIDQRRADASDVRHVDYYLMAHDGPDGTGEQRIGSYLSSLAKSDPSFAIPSDRTIRYERVAPPGSATDPRPYTRTYYVMAQAGLTGSSVADAQVAFDPDSHGPIVLVDLDRAGGLVFGELTARLVGKKLAIVVDGKVASAPIINSAIRNGRISIWMGGSDPRAGERAAEKLVNALRAGALPARP
ncbi:MAG: hypothetical protein KIT31_32845 [Deltaproteobacteria bacterium]|nr:hypothetical protein [Deltaproteobacteria bacterium]